MDLSFGYSGKDVCTEPDALNIAPAEDAASLGTISLSYEDLYCGSDDALKILCYSNADVPDVEDPVVNQIRALYAFRDSVKSAWAAERVCNKGAGDKCALEVEGDQENLAETINNALVCLKVCNPEMEIDDQYPYCSGEWWLLPWGGCDVECQGGQKCNPMLNKCVTCVSDTDCPGSSCSVLMGICSCLTDNDCPDPEAPACLDGSCVECTISNHARCDAQNLVCDTRMNDCVKCTNLDTSRCGEGEACINNQCVFSCNPACTDPTPVCLNDGSCVACSQDDDLYCVEQDKVCKVVMHECVDCVANEDCDTGYCLDTDNTCQECLSRSHCTNPDEPYCERPDYNCVECLSSLHCDAGEACLNNACATRPSCSEDANCYTYDLKQCVGVVNKKCYECVTDSDCSTNTTRQDCNSVDGGECVQCKTNTDCTLDCDSTTKQCTCTVSSDCPYSANGQTCIGGLCEDLD